MTDDFPSKTKAIATVRDVARMVGLSPARFYQLQQSGVFPLPMYDINTRRPHYTEEQQRECLEVRRRNCGVNGKPILFYARRLDATPPAARPRGGRKEKIPGPKGGPQVEIVEDLKGLGLTTVTAAQVEAAARELFPKGTTGMDHAEVVRSIFIHLRRQNSGDSVGR